MTASPDKIDIAEKFGQFSEQWQPKIVADLDDYEIKLVRLEGDFVWHQHEDADEMFFVIDGTLRMDFRDRQVHVGAGEMIVVPRGVEHKPFAAAECRIMLLERKGVPNTGDGPASDRTAAPERL